ncbi:MAG: FAD:protein FMN transferase [Lachnospiraceae bacterium]|nr:FAD:protein FMN transferase [Lachnospiraceae bacterium]
MRNKVLQKIFPAFGTINTITLYDNADLDIVQQIKKRALEQHQRFSVFESGSDISRINEQAGRKPVSVHQDTFFVLSHALAYGRQTQGAFDITSGASSRLWREAIYSGKLPSEADIAECCGLKGLNDLILDKADGTVFLPRKGQQIDLGGIAKGYAADEAVQILKKYKIPNAVINFGGTVVVLGKAKRIGIQNPFQKSGERMGDIEIKNKAVVTSGSYERGFTLKGRRYHHIIDPRTGWPAESGLLSVTLIGDSAMELDGLATGVCVLGEQKGLPLLKRRGIEAVFINDAGEVKITPGLQGNMLQKRRVCGAEFRKTKFFFLKK